MAKRKTKSAAGVTEAPVAEAIAPAAEGSPESSPASAAGETETPMIVAASSESNGLVEPAEAISEARSSELPSEERLAGDATAEAATALGGPATEPGAAPSAGALASANADAVAVAAVEHGDKAAADGPKGASKPEALHDDIGLIAAAPKVDAGRSVLAEAAARRQAARDAAAVTAAVEAEQDRRRRWLGGMALAATVAVAAAIGAIAGALGPELMRPADAAAPKPDTHEQLLALQDGLSRIQAEMAGLRARIDSDLTSLDTRLAASLKSTGDRVDQLGARLATFGDHQTEVSEQLTRIAEATAAGADRDADLKTQVAALSEAVQRTALPDNVDTAAITAAIPEQAASEDKPGASTPTIIEGWTVVDVFRGRALIDGRRHGLFEVAPGAPIPGIGRVESIEQRGGRWVVVTSGGLIVSAADFRRRQF